VQQQELKAALRFLSGPICLVPAVARVPGQVQAVVARLLVSSATPRLRAVLTSAAARVAARHMATVALVRLPLSQAQRRRQLPMVLVAAAAVKTQQAATAAME
jgi:hypothetical protein